jgi:hypothetical protein
MKVTLLILIFLIFIVNQAVFIETNMLTKEVDVKGLLRLRDVVRSIDGSDNNLKHANWGKSYTNLNRRTPARYQDGKS